MVMFPVHQVWPNHLARHSERGKKTRRTKEEVGRQHQGMDRPGVRQVPEGSGDQGKMKKTGCKIICGAPTTLAVKGLMMMMMCLFKQFLIFVSNGRTRAPQVKLPTEKSRQILTKCSIDLSLVSSAHTSSLKTEGQLLLLLFIG